MNTLIKNGALALLLVFATTLTLSAQIKPSKQKPSNTEQTDQPSPSNSTDAKPSFSSKKKTAAKKTDQYFDESGGFKHRLQYGAHMNPSILSLFGSQFNIRIDPIVGYKINNWAMAGIITGLDYTSFRYSFQGAQGIESYKYNAVNLSGGVYARAKAFKSFYVHTDYRLAKYKRVNQSTPFDVTNKKINVESITKPEWNVGAVYRSGMGAVGYEFMATYNVLFNDSYLGYKDTPFDIKVGLTYNF